MKPATLLALFALACAPPPSSEPDAGDANHDAGVTPHDAGTIEEVPDEPDAECTANGCLREATSLGTYSKSQVERGLQGGVEIENGYEIWSIRYVTDGAESLATVTVPDVAPPEGGFHVVANNHGTSGLDDKCKLTGTAYGAGLAGLFGARGAIGVATDYPGLGTDGLHPYLVSRVEGAAVLDALRAATHLAKWRGHAVSGRTAMVGLSQGGHATLAAAALKASYAPELDVRAVGVTAPAAVWESQWSQGASVSGAHVAYHAMVAYAWSHHYAWPSEQPLWTEDFASKVDSVMQRCIVSLTGQTIDAGVPDDPAKVFAPAFLAAYRTREWGDYAFVHDAFEANAIRAFAQPAALRIYQGDDDTTVPEAATKALVEALRAGGMTVEYEVVPGGVHTNVAFGFVASAELRTDESIAWVRAKLEE